MRLNRQYEAHIDPALYAEMSRLAAPVTRIPYPHEDLAEGKRGGYTEPQFRVWMDKRKTLRDRQRTAYLLGVVPPAIEAMGYSRETALVLAATLFSMGHRGVGGVGDCEGTDKLRPPILGALCGSGTRNNAVDSLAWDRACLHAERACLQSLGEFSDVASWGVHLNIAQEDGPVIFPCNNMGETLEDDGEESLTLDQPCWDLVLPMRWRVSFARRYALGRIGYPPYAVPHPSDWEAAIDYLTGETP